ncbi:unnamed protein product, partial [Oikopleura dioica]
EILNLQMRPGIKPKRLDEDLGEEELIIRERKRKSNKETAAKRRIEFKKTVAMLESTMANLESENESIENEVAMLKTKIARIEAALILSAEIRDLSISSDTAPDKQDNISVENDVSVTCPSCSRKLLIKL